jgi:hypothetical protein
VRNNTLALALFRAELCRAYAVDRAKLRLIAGDPHDYEAARPRPVHGRPWARRSLGRDLKPSTESPLPPD